MRADTEIQQGRYQAGPPHFRVVGGLVESQPRESDPLPVGSQDPSSLFQRLRVPVHPQEPAAGQRFQKRPGMSASTHGPVQDQPCL